jgi:DNA-binding Xre family transcriptional regulator
MKKRKDLPGYPGDDAIKKAFGETLRALRQERGLSIDEADALLEEAMRTEAHPLLPRALGIVVRQLREREEMSRKQLSDASGLSSRFITNLERGKVNDPTLTQIVRLAMALNQQVADLVEQVEHKEKELTPA